MQKHQGKWNPGAPKHPGPPKHPYPSATGSYEQDPRLVVKEQSKVQKNQRVSVVNVHVRITQVSMSVHVCANVCVCVFKYMCICAYVAKVPSLGRCKQHQPRTLRSQQQTMIPSRLLQATNGLIRLPYSMGEG